MTFLSITRSCALALTLPLAVGCGVSPDEGGSSDDESAEEFVGKTSQALNPDPAHNVSGGWCLYKRTVGGVAGRIYYPPAGSCKAMPYSPLVVMLPGTGYSFKQYNYLMKHLARNGFVAVSLDVLAENASTHGAAVADALDYLTWMRTSWSKALYLDRTNVGLIGHSRGGGTARHLAQAMNAPSQPWTVRALMGLASVASDGLFADNAMTNAVMMLHGSYDGDRFPDSSYRLYDRSGVAGSSFGDIDKSMKLFEDGVHANFAEIIDPIHGENIIVPQAISTRGYALAFLAAHLKADSTWYEDYVRGSAIPNGWQSGEVASQFRNGIVRTVVENNEDGNVSLNTIGGSVFLESANATNRNLATVDSSYHETRVMSVIGLGTSSYVSWRVPSGSGNVAGHKFLSLRIGQLSGAPVEDLEVEIRNDGVWSSAVSLIAYGEVGQRMQMCTKQAAGSTKFCGETELKSHMQTIRVPLSAFGAANDVEWVRLRFRGDAAYRTFYVDDVEFAGWLGQ